MQPSLVVYSNVIPFIGLLFILVFTLTNPLFSKRQIKLFVLAVILNAVMLVVISLDYNLQSSDMENAWAWRRITSFMNFAMAPVVPLMLFKIFDKTARKWWYYGPIIANIGLCFVSIFVKVVFFIPESNGYERGPLFFVPFLISVAYIAWMMVKPVTVHSRSKRIEQLFLAAVIAMLVFCMYMEIVVGYHFLSWDGAVLAFILYYLLLTLYCFTVDALTNAYNRLMYSRSLGNLGRKAGYTVAMLDLNDFKEVNDKYGHDVGDKTLICFTDCVTQKLPKGALLFRVGGDEFSVIYKNIDTEKLADSLAEAREELNGKNIFFAYGMAVHTPGENKEIALKLADELMYENKMQMKAQAKKER